MISFHTAVALRAVPALSAAATIVSTAIGAAASATAASDWIVKKYCSCMSKNGDNTSGT